MNKRIARHLKIRKRIVGLNQRPRLAVFRSNDHIYAQIIDDQKQVTLVSSSDLKLKNSAKKLDAAFEVGSDLAKQAIKLGITQVVFDRGGYLYHGRVARLATGAREGGLKF